MRKLSKLIIALIVMIFGLCISTRDVNAKDGVIDPEEMFEIQNEACQAHQKLMSVIDPNYKCVFPSDFSGDYIDDYGKLHILLTCDKNINLYKNMMSEFDCVVFEFQEKSYNELSKEMNEFIKKYEDSFDIKSYGVDILNNRVIVTIDENDKEKYEKLNYQMPSNIYCEFSSNCREESSVVGGAKIWDNGYCTLAGSGTYNGYTAFLTCGHGSAVNNIVTHNGNTIGTVKVQVCASGSSGDYAIIKAASGYTATSSVLTGSTTINFTGFLYHPAVGTYLYKFGQTTGQSYCKVTIYSTTESGITNLSRAQIITGSSAVGDSGGPYRCGTQFCGVHRGSIDIGGTTYVTFTPYVVVHNAGFSIKTN